MSLNSEKFCPWMLANTLIFCTRPGTISRLLNVLGSTMSCEAYECRDYFGNFGKGPKAFLFGKLSKVNPEFGKFSKYSQLIKFSNVTYLIKAFHLESLNKHCFKQQSLNFTMYGTVEKKTSLIGIFSSNWVKKSPKLHWEWGRISHPPPPPPLRHPKKIPGDVLGQITIGVYWNDNYMSLSMFMVASNTIFVATRVWDVSNLSQIDAVYSNQTCQI